MIKDANLKQYAQESILVMFFQVLLIFILGTGFVLILNYYGYDFYRPFIFSSFIEESAWTLFMLFGGFCFGVLVIIEKIQDSRRKET